MSGSRSARRGARKKDAQVSLFPFLAVLICTMGALIVLLVVLVQQARVHAEHLADERRAEAAHASHLSEAARQELEDYDWRTEILQQQREEIVQKLAGERLKLSHVEDHYRRLKAELQSLVQQAHEMDRLVQGGAQDSEAARQELARLQQAIEAAQLAVEQAEQQANQKPQSFAIIPYDGPGNTRRRPIYIECLKDRIVLQPEGVTLTDRDFDGPLGPGNPLDAGLRAAREYLARTGGVERHGEPYPLLIVRAQGARAYAAARAAIESWDDEFGYELIDDDLKLTYLPPDPALREAMQAAVEEGRRRQGILRAAQPNRYDRRAASGFQATPHRGGFRAVGDIAGADTGDKSGLTGSDQHGEFETIMGGAGDDATKPSSDSVASSEANGGSGALSGGNAGGSAGPSLSAVGGAKSNPGASFSATRGRDWGLKNATAGATAYTRPINMRCERHQFVVVPERGTEQEPVVIPLTGSTRAAVDPLVQALWKRMERWGLAGNHAYWKPVLKVEVAPDAETRFAELQWLLEGSGLILERKTP
jgi:hypothetical protein